MSTQIALYKLDAIRKSLVANRFNKKKADNLKTIGKLSLFMMLYWQLFLNILWICLLKKSPIISIMTLK